eukprot:3161545-Rhodomonas_salina.2
MCSADIGYAAVRRNPDEVLRLVQAFQFTDRDARGLKCNGTEIAYRSSTDTAFRQMHTVRCVRQAGGQVRNQKLKRTVSAQFVWVPNMRPRLFDLAVDR